MSNRICSDRVVGTPGTNPMNRVSDRVLGQRGGGSVSDGMGPPVVQGTPFPPSSSTSPSSLSPMGAHTLASGHWHGPTPPTGTGMAERAWPSPVCAEEHGQKHRCWYWSNTALLLAMRKYIAG